MTVDNNVTFNHLDTGYCDDVFNLFIIYASKISNEETIV